MDRAISLPVHHALTSDDIGYLCDVTDELFADDAPSRNGAGVSGGNRP